VSYPDFVQSRLKPGADVLADLTPEKANLAHLAMLVTSEAGELADAIKKHTIYGNPLDVANIHEELGDILFAAQAIATATGTTLDECQRLNVEKLTVRFPNGYSNTAAIQRADKAEDTSTRPEWWHKLNKASPAHAALAWERYEQEPNKELPAPEGFIAAFMWASTPEGDDFWVDVSDWLDGEIKELPPMSKATT